jgi:NADH-quinone oxidoreductase subunit H
MKVDGLYSISYLVFGKTFFLIFVIMWIPWTFPELRIDQLLNLEWNTCCRISMFNLLLVTVIAILKWHF